jgi:hypothetical protein
VQLLHDQRYGRYQAHFPGQLDQKDFQPGHRVRLEVLDLLAEQIEDALHVLLTVAGQRLHDPAS